MRKILLLGDFDATGGTGTYFRRLAELLRNHYDIHIALRGEQRNIGNIEFLEKGQYSYSVDFSFLKKLDRFAARAARRLDLTLLYWWCRDSVSFRLLARKYKPDLVFISQGGGMRFFSALTLTEPVAIVCHSLQSQPAAKSALDRQFFRLFRRLDISRKRIVHVSEHAAALFKENIPCKNLREASIVIHNFGKSFPVARESGPRLRVLTLGHVVGYKNPILWLEVARRVDEEFPGRFEWVWAGLGSMLADCKARAKPFTNIHFIGYRPDVVELYQNCDVYFQPSIWENHSISVIEAMGSGLPCVVSRAGGLPETIRDRIDGFVCGVDSVEQYAAAFAELFRDSDLRQRMGRNARLRFDECYTENAWSRKVISMIESIVDDKPRGFIIKKLEKA
jgi:glycosyltransferase involved in cell wall biosynthesis